MTKEALVRGERPLPNDHWRPETPAEERALYATAWQAYRACRDCRWWGDNDDEPDETALAWKVACCGAPGNRSPCASFMTPEDYTCGEFEPVRARAAGVPVMEVDR